MLPALLLSPTSALLVAALPASAMRDPAPSSDSWAPELIVVI
jgi:hypothetical protein